MGDMLKELREKSRKRKLLLAQTVSFIDEERGNFDLKVKFFSLAFLEPKNLGKYLERQKEQLKRKKMKLTVIMKWKNMTIRRNLWMN